MKLALRSPLFLALAIFVLASCQKNLPHIQSLKVNSLNPASAGYGSSVTISGTGFSAVKANDQVYFNGVSAVITAVTDTTITATVPVSAGTGPVTVSVNGSALVTGPIFTYQTTALVTTVAGTGLSGNINGPAASATFNALFGIAIDSKGNIFLGDATVIREISNGTVSTFAGKLGATASADGTGTTAGFKYAGWMTIDASDNLYVSDYGTLGVRKITPAAVVTSISIAGMTASVSGVTVDGSGSVFIADAFTDKIYKVAPTGYSIVFAGTGSAGSADGIGTAASFSLINGLTSDNTGNVYVADESNNKIRKITPSGVVTTLAGSGLKGAVDGAGSSATFTMPLGVAVDATGNVYVADTYSNKIRKLTPGGTVSTIAGDGNAVSKDGIGTSSSFKNPIGIAIDATGSLYITEQNKLRKIIFQ